MSQDFLEHLNLLIITRSYPEDLITAKTTGQTSVGLQLGSNCPKGFLRH